MIFDLTHLLTLKPKSCQKLSFIGTIKKIENTQNQYNLVCNVLMEVCGCNDNEKLNDIAILCCEFTAQCPSLSSEWMGAFAALCNAPVDYGYQVCTFIL